MNNLKLRSITTLRLALALILLAVASLCNAEPAPDFSLMGDSKVIRLADFRNQVVYLDFWASWCRPCRKSFPFMNRMHNKYRDQGLVVIAINLDDEFKQAQKFLKTTPAEFIIAYDHKGVTPEKYKIAVMPTSFLIDHNGNIVSIHKGFKNSHKEKIEQHIVQLLAKKTASNE